MKLLETIRGWVDDYDSKPKLGHIIHKQGGWTAAAIVGSAIVGAVASDRAADKQSKSAKKGIDATNALLSPYTDAGAESIGSLQRFIDQGVKFSDTQAFKDIINSRKAGAGSGYQSGGRDTALIDYYATNFRPQQLAEQSLLYRGGVSAAGGQANLLSNQYNAQGAAQANGIYGVGNSINSGLNSFAFLQSQQNMNGSNLSNTGGQPFGTYYNNSWGTAGAGQNPLLNYSGYRGITG